ncbi:MAG: Shedu anti-phage system protein SduA domain-containing protein [Patescibacteria group bacterium]
MLTDDQRKRLKMWAVEPDYENTDFVVGSDSLTTIEIDKTGTNGFWYFKNTKKGLIKRFVLEESAKVEKSCVITLIKKENGKFTPRFSFEIRDISNKAISNFSKETQDDKLIKARVDLDSCHENFFGLINFIKGIEEIDFDATSYTIVDPEKVIITDENKVAYVKKLIDAGYGEDVWVYLSESNPTLIQKLTYARIQSKKQNVIDELGMRLEHGNYSETTGDDSWQKWIYKNNWLFGVNYQKPIEKAKINLTGIMPDYLFPTLDGFVDILEIKLPSDEVIIKDTSHTNAWRWSAETNVAIGQVINYLSEVDRLRREIEPNIAQIYNIELSLLKPHAYILIGDSTNWDIYKRDALRKMNHALHGIEVITYKDLLDRGNASMHLSREKL